MGLRCIFRELLKPRAALAALIERIGTVLFSVGGNYQDSSATTGRLFLSINDTAGHFADNHGLLQASISVLPSLASIGGKQKEKGLFQLPAAQAIAFEGPVLDGGRIQLSQTSEGTPLVVVVEGASRWGCGASIRR